jgi:hypothetical protein
MVALSRQPQERQHSAVFFGGTRDRLPPAWGAMILARGIVTAWPRGRFPRLPDLRRLSERSE